MKPKREGSLGKTTIFSIFLFGSVLLIITIIASDLMGGAVDSSDSLRSTPALVTSEGFEKTLSAAPTKGQGEGHNGGQGQGKENGEGDDHDDLPTPTFNLTTYPTEDDV